MRDIVDDEHWGLASTVRQLLGVYQENIDLIQVGAYQQGTNPTLEAAIAMMPTIEAFLRQDINEHSTLREALQGMRDLFNRGR
jgi:flagellum-specific ATP synthase